MESVNYTKKKENFNFFFQAMKGFVQKHKACSSLVAELYFPRVLPFQDRAGESVIL